MINDRNLVIICITALVACYAIVTKGSTDAGDIIEKAIIALGSLTTGSILGGIRQSKKSSISEKDIKKNAIDEYVEAQQSQNKYPETPKK